MRRGLDPPYRGPGGLVAATALDAELPEFDVASHHEIEIAAPRERVWQALLEHDLGTSVQAKVLLALRGYGLRAARSSSAGTLSDRLERFGFTKLDEVPGEELVFGLAGRFWRPDGGLEWLADAAAFRAFTREGRVKAAWNLRVVALEAGSSRLTTETRVRCFGNDARRRFGLYWAFIRPFSGLIRRMLLGGIRERATATAVGTSSR